MSKVSARAFVENPPLMFGLRIISTLRLAISNGVCFPIVGHFRDATHGPPRPQQLYFLIIQSHQGISVLCRFDDQCTSRRLGKPALPLLLIYCPADVYPYKVVNT